MSVDVTETPDPISGAGAAMINSSVSDDLFLMTASVVSLLTT